MAGDFKKVTHYVFRARPYQCVRRRLHGLDCKKICDSPLTWGTGALFYEFRETRTGPCVEPVFFRAQGRADLGQINDEGRILPCTEGSGDL
jgi:hypothetical protein